MFQDHVSGASSQRPGKVQAKAVLRVGARFWCGASPALDGASSS